MIRPRVKYVIGPDGSPLTIADLPPPNTRRWVIRRKAEVVAAVRGGLGGFKSQELANLAWAMTQDGHVTPALFDGLIVQAHLCLAPEVAAPHRLNAQDISTIAWAFAASREAAPQAYADHFGWRLLQTPFWEWDALSHADPAASLRARSESLSLALAASANAPIPKTTTGVFRM